MYWSWNLNTNVSGLARYTTILFYGHLVALPLLANSVVSVKRRHAQKGCSRIALYSFSYCASHSFSFLSQINPPSRCSTNPNKEGPCKNSRHVADERTYSRHNLLGFLLLADELAIGTNIMSLGKLEEVGGIGDLRVLREEVVGLDALDAAAEGILVQAHLLVREVVGVDLVQLHLVELGLGVLVALELVDALLSPAKGVEAVHAIDVAHLRTSLLQLEGTQGVLTDELLVLFLEVVVSDVLVQLLVHGLGLAPGVEGEDVTVVANVGRALTSLDALSNIAGALD